MASMQKVLLCGGSLLMAGLQASLQSMPGLELERVVARPDSLRRRMYEHPPDVLIVELTIIEGDSILSLLSEFPRLIVVGLDPDSEQILLLSLQQETPLTAADLVRLLQVQVEARSKRMAKNAGGFDLFTEKERKQ